MLTYFIETSERLGLFAICLGIMFAYEHCVIGKKEVKFILWGTVAGFGLALIMTYLKLNTALIDTGLWNLRIHITSIILIILFVVLINLKETSTKLRTKKNNTEGFKEKLTRIILFILTALMGLYYFPNVLEMPRRMLRMEDSIISTDFITKMLSVIFGIILVYLLGISIYKTLISKNKKQITIIMCSILGINTLKYIGITIGTLVIRRYIPSNDVLFFISKNTSNYSDWFIYISMIIVVIIQIVIIIKSFTQKETYENPAQKRKIIAKWKKFRKWGIVTILCVLLILLTLTVIKAYDDREVELSPTEETKQDETNMYVSFDQVSDGLLHRYAYETDDGVLIRFIVIQKPNSSAYGIGLDACEICGETGYYQRGELVVCNLCDVVMNINTIGFKGGCNPIVIDYSLENGQIVVPIEGLLEHKDEFK